MFTRDCNGGDTSHASVSSCDPRCHVSFEVRQFISGRHLNGLLAISVHSNQHGHTEGVWVGDRVGVPQKRVEAQLVVVTRVFGSGLEVSDMGSIGPDPKQVHSPADAKIIRSEFQFRIRSKPH